MGGPGTRDPGAREGVPQQPSLQGVKEGGESLVGRASRGGSLVSREGRGHLETTGGVSDRPLPCQHLCPLGP